MKTYAHHDSDGNIKSLINVNAPGNAGLMLTPKAGLFVSELEDIKFKTKTPETEELHEIARSYKVVTPHLKSKIQKKSK